MRPEYRGWQSAIVLAGEHPAEFNCAQLLFKRIQFRDGFVKRLFVVGFYRQFSSPETRRPAPESFDQAYRRSLRRRTLFSQRLRARVRSDIRLFQLGVYSSRRSFLAS